jgi:hypothetical protein
MMRRFAQAAVVAAAMSAPIVVGVMIAPQAQAASGQCQHSARGVVTEPNGGLGFQRACSQTPDVTNDFKQAVRDDGGKANGSPTTFPGPNKDR